MKEETLDFILTVMKIIFIIDMAAFIFLIGYSYGSGNLLETALKKSNVSTNCSQSSLVDTIECLNNDFNTWYVFNLSNVGKELNESQFKSSGGVCSHATDWYLDRLDSLNYSTMRLSLKPQNKSEYGHAFLVAWDYNLNTYCVIDQRYYTCRSLS